jgi:hypothetical protein
MPSNSSDKAPPISIWLIWEFQPARIDLKRGCTAEIPRQSARFTVYAGNSTCQAGVTDDSNTTQMQTDPQYYYNTSIAPEDAPDQLALNHRHGVTPRKAGRDHAR